MVKSRNTDVDVVIPVHGEFELLRKCVAALPAAMGEYAYRIVLVDDISPQPLSEVWEEITAGQDARLLINDERRGFAHTCNRGSKFGFSPYVLFLNSDCVLTEKAGAILMDTLKEAPDIGIASPLLLFPEDQSVSYRPAGKVQHAGMAFDLHGTPLHIFVGWSPDNPKVKHHREVQAVTGACMAVKRETINKVGELIRRFDKKFQQGMFFQEDYGMGTYEDIDACFCTRSVGYKIVFNPDAVGYHYTGASAVASKTQFPLQRNDMIFRARFGHLIKWDEYVFV